MFGYISQLSVNRSMKAVPAALSVSGQGMYVGAVFQDDHLATRQQILVHLCDKGINLVFGCVFREADADSAGFSLNWKRDSPSTEASPPSKFTS